MSFYKKKKSLDEELPITKPIEEMSLSQMEDEGNLVRQLSDKELRKNSRKIDSQIRKERNKREEEEDNPRVLILGTSDSGKSTLLKQLKILHGGGFTEKEIEYYRSQMYLNILASASIIVIQCTLLDLWPEDEGHQEVMTRLT
jgi:ABC-type polar amino acid transport system ATPase subunit